MYINESRRGDSGIGFLALQDHGWQQAGVSLDQRITLMGVRALDRDRDEYPVGYYNYEAGTIGDIIGSNLWQSSAVTTSGSSSSNAEGRELHGWRFTPWPVKTIEFKDPMKPTTQAGLRGGGHCRGAEVPAGNIHMLPIRDGQWGIDPRFQKKPVNFAPGLPKPAVGTHGIVVSADNEGQQDDLFFSMETGRMIAVNWAGDPSMGSLVADLNANSEVDPDRVARLQSAFRVIKTKKAKGCVNFVDNVIALQMGPSGCGDATGGIVWDTKTGGVLGQNMGSGPLTVGDPKEDKHKLSVDEDGHHINSAHISTNAYFFMDNIYDAPLKFDSRWGGASVGQESFEVYLEYDEDWQHAHKCGLREGIWRWRSTATVGSSTVPPPPTGIPPAGGPPMIPIRIDFGAGDFFPPPFLPLVGYKKTVDGMSWAQTTTALSSPTMLFQPQFFSDGVPDTRVWGEIPPEERDQQKSQSPIVGYFDSFGLQTDEDWSYYDSPFLGRGRTFPNRGTAHGGVAFLAPQICLSDYAAERSTDVSTSTATFVISDSTRLGFGTPSVSDEGGMSEGFYQKYDPSTRYMEIRREDDERYLYMEHAGNNRVVFEQPVGVNKCFNLGETTVALASNTITPTSSNMVVTQAGSYDYLYTINTSGVTEGQIVIVKCESGKQLYVSESSGGNIHGSTASLSAVDNVAGLIYTAGAWTIIFKKEG